MSNLLFEHYSHGKLLLSGEYYVLDGATALAIPTKLGQYFEVYQMESDAPIISWKSYDNKNELWLSANFYFKEGIYFLENTSNDSAGARLEQLLNVAFELSSKKIDSPVEIRSYLQFPIDWGLGSSSTFLTSLSKWLDINPYHLLSKTFGGSGYDIACATSEQPIFFNRKNGEVLVTPIDLNFPFKENICFVHLGKKQNSKLAVEHYKKVLFEDKQELISHISGISEGMAHTLGIDNFMNYMNNHELLVANNIRLERVKNLYFSDFKGSIKSLGAWGGDFVMACARDSKYIPEYFKSKGYPTVIRYNEMIWN